MPSYNLTLSLSLFSLKRISPNSSDNNSSLLSLFLHLFIKDNKFSICKLLPSNNCSLVELSIEDNSSGNKFYYQINLKYIYYLTYIIYIIKLSR